MPVIRTLTDRIAAGLGDRVIRHRWLIILATLAIAVAASNGVRYLEFSNNYRVFFSDKNPELVAFDQFQKTYTKNDNILFVLQAKKGEIFTPRIAAAIEVLTAEAWKIPFAIRVDSVTNFQHSWADGDDLTVEDLVRNGAELAPEDLARRQEIALAEPLLSGNLIASDARTTGVNVTLQYPQISLTEVPEAVGFARGLATRIRADYPELRVVLSGISMLNHAFAESGQADAATLVPVMYAVLIIVMIIALRNVWGGLSTLLVVGFSTVSAMGLAGYVGIKLTPISISAPTIILTLAIADSVHILMSMVELMREGKDKLTALKESIFINFLAVTITSLTTIIGFLTLNFSDAPPFWDLGNITAMGIAAAWIYSLLFLPAVASLLPFRVKVRADGTQVHEGALERLARWVVARYRAVLICTGALTITLIAAVPTLELNDSWVKYFGPGMTFRHDTDFATKYLSGPYPIEFSIKAEEPGGISEPMYLEKLDSFTAWLRAQPEVRHVYSVTDIFKRLNKNMHGDDSDWYRIPNQRELAAQYLVLYELSLPYGLDLNDRMSIDKGATRVTATLDDVSTVEVRDFIGRAENWLAESTPSHMHTKPTGSPVMFSYISQRNIESMLRGNLFAVILIAAVMALSLRSFPLGLLSLVPNAVPILMTFGVWALIVGQVGMAAATVSATSLGIIVDNTVHFMTKYLRARRDRDFGRPEAIRYAFRTVGAAIAANAAILALGFAVLAASTFRINAELGLLTALAIIIALTVDFLLLPALLLIGHEKEKAHAKF